ncbi:MAG: hypothetical protein FVQ80_16645 [Planctomycetes bacterium]|nr:hypothetical protein [Planctomycetota bacterium]
MMKIFYVIFIFILSLILISCTPTFKYYNEEDKLPGPYPEEYEQLVKEYILNRLKDPDSMKDFSIKPPSVGEFFIFERPPKDGKIIKLFVGCVKYNAKNSFGGYVGRKANVYFIKRDKVLVVVKAAFRYSYKDDYSQYCQ